MQLLINFKSINNKIKLLSISISGNDTKEETDNNLNLFPTPLGKTMYQCPEEQTVNIGEKIKVTFSEVSLIAYNEEILKPEEFSGELIK